MSIDRLKGIIKFKIFPPTMKFLIFFFLVIYIAPFRKKYSFFFSELIKLKDNFFFEKFKNFLLFIRYPKKRKKIEIFLILNHYFFWLKFRR